jgi:hypothetical protein
MIWEKECKSHAAPFQSPKAHHVAKRTYTAPGNHPIRHPGGGGGFLFRVVVDGGNWLPTLSVMTDVGRACNDTMRVVDPTAATEAMLYNL